jgi:hypothetical protein
MACAQIFLVIAILYPASLLYFLSFYFYFFFSMKFGQQFAMLLTQCWDPLPANRPSFGAIVEAIEKYNAPI